MIKRTFCFLGLLAVCFQGSAAILPAEKLLPKDTIALITVADGAKSWTSFTNSSYGQLWCDPAMKAFKDKFVTKLQSDLVGPVERELGIKLADYQNLIQGQVTFALLKDDANAESPFSPLFLLDAKDKADHLKKTLADTKKKWVDAGKSIKTEEIRGVPFTTFITSSTDVSNTLSKVFPNNKPAAKNGDDDDADNDSEDKKASKPEKIEFLIGQVDSLLIVGHSSKAIEKVLNRQAGGLIPALSEEPAFQGDYNARLRGTPAYVWVNANALLDMFLSNSAESADSNNPFGNKEKILAAVGLKGVKTLALTWQDTSEGFMTQIFVGVPEANRRGLFELLRAKAKDSNPPPFVPADVIKFVRWRLDLQKTWSTFEDMLGEISPSAKGMASMMFESAGKEKDENYDLKAELLGNLGDDIINYQKAPRGTTLPEMASPPSLFLIGSPNPDRLAIAVKVVLNAVARAIPTKESEFLGRKIYSITMPQRGGESKTTSFAANGGYLAVSTDIAMLEEYLRSSDSKAKALSETAGLSAAAQKVGGMNTGLFGFNDQRKEMKIAFDALRKSSGNLADLLGNPALAGKDTAKELNAWADFSLLPPFDSVSKYFYYTVSAGRFGADGFTFSYFAPNPPKK